MIKKLYRDILILGLKGFIGNFMHEVKMLMWAVFLNSYSQNKEDIIIDRLLKREKYGFYVDVGAFDPTRFNNTKRFYLKGWHGINIEPDPARIKKFYEKRPKDINLNIGVAGKNGVLTFHKFDPPTLSTFSKSVAKDYQKQGFKLTETMKIQVGKLGDILAKYQKSKEIDFFSIDTEGFDLEVLKGNSWKRFKPKVICIEENGSQEKYLSRLGYRKVHQTPINSIFVLKTV